MIIVRRKYCLRILLGLLTLLTGLSSYAQNFSYVYIQGDKKTPIYTKVEGVMMPRYGKHYALLPRLAPGPMNLEILFQQNEYPAVQFNILVPENGKRAFIVQRKDGETYLYDVEQNFYLKPNNDISEDHIPTLLSNAQLAANKGENSSSANTVSETQTSKVKINEGTEGIDNSQKDKIDVSNLDSKQNSSTAKDEEPKFIQDIVFDNNKDNSTSTAPNNNAIQTNSEATNTEATIVKTEPNETPQILNSDCKAVIPSLAYIRIKNSMNSKKGENERLGIILDACKQYCFRTEQAIEMLSKLESDVAKLTAIKKIFPKTIDQGNFTQVESVLTEEEWKEYFRTNILPQ